MTDAHDHLVRHQERSAELLAVIDDARLRLRAARHVSEKRLAEFDEATALFAEHHEEGQRLLDTLEDQC